MNRDAADVMCSFIAALTYADPHNGVSFDVIFHVDCLTFARSLYLRLTPMCLLQVSKTATKVYSVKATCTLADVLITDFQQAAYRNKV